MLKAIKYSFDVPFNGNQIDNQFNDENARYYVIETPLWIYLQAYKPFVEWYEMITDDNFEEISNNHIQTIERNILEQEKFILKWNVTESLITSSDISLVDLEWVEFTNEEVGDIILKRVFGGNPHAQIALQSKYLGVLTKRLEWDKLVASDFDIIKDIELKRSEINKVREKFLLSSI